MPKNYHFFIIFLIFELATASLIYKLVFSCFLTIINFKAKYYITNDSQIMISFHQRMIQAIVALLKVGHNQIGQGLFGT